MEVIKHRNYVLLLLALEIHVFSMFVPYSALIRPSLVQSGLKVGPLVKLPYQD